MKTWNLRLSLILTLAFTLITAAVALAIPQTITYQGLLSEDGELVTGTKSVTFGIYAASTGGTALWEEVQSVEFENGAFGVVLGSETAIPTSVFGGARRWLSVTIAGGSEMLPRPEIVSVGYAFHAETANDASSLGGREDWEYAGSVHSHDSRYYTQSTLNTTDGDPPNEGSNLLHWDNLNGMPTGFADGIDDAGGVNDHGQLTGLADDDHTQYARETVLKTSDGTAPNEGSNQVHWDNLDGVPADFADGVDDTLQGGPVDHGGLTGLEDDDHPQYAQDLVLQASDGTGPNEGSNQVHWDNLAGVPADLADSTDDMCAPVLVHVEVDDYESNYDELTVIASVTIDAPDTGVVHITFSGTQVLDVDLEGTWQPKRYIAEYGVAVDDSSGFDYFVRSSMYDTEQVAVDLVLDQYLPSNPVAGTTVQPVAAGTHTVYLMTDVVHKFDTGATNRFFSPSVAVTYYQFGTTTTPGVKGASSGPPGGADESGATIQESNYR